MKGILPIAGWVTLGLALVVSFGLDLANTSHSGAVDLRNRITGARLLAHGIDPYHYKWHEGEPPEYCDLRNYNLNLPVSKTTVTPALLMLQLPFAPLPYRLTQFLWLGVQWLLLLGTGWLWLRACATPFMGWLVALFLTGFSYTEAWRWEAERGQAYLLYAFFLAWWLTATRDPKRGDGFMAGCVAGFSIALRPPCILLLPFLALHRRGQLIGAAAGLLLGFGLPMLLSPAVWTDYFSSMQTYSNIYRLGLNPPHRTLAYPPTIEGIPTSLLGNLMPFHTGDFSAHALLRQLGLEPFPALPVLAVVVAPFFFWILLSRKQPTESLLTGLVAWLFLTDLFLPAIRFDYHDLFILNVVFAGIVTAGKFPWWAWPCALALPVGWALYAFLPTTRWVLNLPAFFFTLGAILSLFSFPVSGIGSRRCP